MQTKNRLTYVSNAGVLLELSNKKILIDPLCKSVIDFYKDTPKNIEKKIISGTPPFHNIDIIFFTHIHGDHFDLKSTIKFLKNNHKTIIVSNEDVIGEIKKELGNSNDNQLITLNPSLYSGQKILLDNINIHAISMLHDGNEYHDVKNLGYFIEVEDKRILHVGDAKAIQENYMYLNSLKVDIDLLLAPFPYAGTPRGRRLIDQYIKPQKIAALHLPKMELDKYQWIKTTKRSYKRVESQFIQTVFLEDIGEVIEI